MRRFSTVSRRVGGLPCVFLSCRAIWAWCNPTTVAVVLKKGAAAPLPESGQVHCGTAVQRGRGGVVRAGLPCGGAVPAGVLMAFPALVAEDAAVGGAQQADVLLLAVLAGADEVGDEGPVAQAQPPGGG